jgi:hypothetical protein
VELRLASPPSVACPILHHVSAPQERQLPCTAAGCERRHQVMLWQPYSGQTSISLHNSSGVGMIRCCDWLTPHSNCGACFISTAHEPHATALTFGPNILGQLEGGGNSICCPLRLLPVGRAHPGCMCR